MNRMSILFAGVLSAVIITLAAGPGNAAGVQAPAGVEMSQFRAGGHVLGFSRGAVFIAAGTHALRLDFVGSALIRPVSDQSAHPGTPGGTAAPPLSTVVYPDLWPGVSLRYEAAPEGIVKSSCLIAPGADPAAVELRANAPVRVDENGRLHYAFETGEMVESKPVAWQVIDGRRVEVEASFRVAGDKEYGFLVGAYDPEFPLIIDPVLTWNTFLGRAESTVDEARAVATDGTSIIIVCGTSDGPWGNPVRPYGGGASDAYVAKFNTSGTRQWITFLGGEDVDQGRGVAIDTAGNVFIAGTSEATWNGSPRRPFTSAKDGFVAKLNPSGILQWNAFLGGSGDDEGRGIAVDGSGNAYVAGSSEAAWGSNPTRAYTAGRDAFAAKLNSSGTLQWHAFLGGTADDSGNDVVFSLALGGSVFVAGDSQGAWGAPVRAHSGAQDGFAACLNASGALQWNTFVGGTDNDSAEGVAATATGAVFLAGTSSASWGTPVRSFSTGPDPYAAMLNPGGAVFWNTFVGGTGSDSGTDVALDGGGNVYVTGTAGAAWGTPIQSFHGETDAFAVKLTSTGALTWNSFLGSAGFENASGIVVLTSGACAVAGKSDAGPWPAGTPASAYAGDADGFLEIVAASGGFSAYTFMGGLGYDEGKAVDVDSAGNVYVAGISRKTWGTPIRAFTGSSDDVFVAKLNANGALQWLTFLGGSSEDRAAGIAVSAAGIVYIAGQSAGTWGFPLRGYGGGAQDAFAAKLNTDGILQWNTFLGGSAGDFGNGIAVDGSDNAYIVGSSPASWGLPTRTYSGSNDAFAGKLNANGALQWHAFLGGPGSEIGNGIAVDSLGNVYVAGTATASWGSPIVRNFDTSTDGFAAKLNSGGALQWNTFLGGSNSDSANGVAVFGADAVYVTGQSRTTWGTPLAPHPGYWNGFAAELNGNGVLQWNTFFGSSTVLVDPRSADVDSQGNLYIGGTSSGSWGSPFRAQAGNDDTFAAMFDANGALVWNGFFGSPDAEVFGGLAAASWGDVYLAGTGSQDLGKPGGRIRRWHGRLRPADHQRSPADRHRDFAQRRRDLGAGNGPGRHLDVDRAVDQH